MPVKPSDVSARPPKITVKNIVKVIDYRLMNTPRSSQSLTIDITKDKWSREIKDEIKRIYNAEGWKVYYHDGGSWEKVMVTFKPKQ